ncbi:ATP-binding protein [Paenibacillus sp. y28]
MIIVILLTVFVVTYAQTIPNRTAPLARQGLLDLTNWDFSKHGVVPLDGEWEFYAGRLLEPDDFKLPSAPKPAFLAVPGLWKGPAQSGMSNQGVGTYRLRVKLPFSDEVLGMKVKSIRMSHLIYINGKVTGSSGRPAAVKADHEPGNTPYSTYFHTAGQEVEIILQTANYVYPSGGVVNSILFGKQRDITKLNSIQMGSDIAIAFIVAMFGVYHLSFYFLGRRDKTYIYSGLYLLTIMVRQLLYGEKLMMQLPGMPFEVSYKLLDLSDFIGAAFIFLLVCSIDTRLITKRNLILLMVPIVLYVAAVIVLPYLLHSELKPFFLVYIQLVSLYLLGKMLVLYSRNESGSANRKELIVFIGGVISLTVFFVNEVLYVMNAVPTDLAGKLGIVGFILCVNMLLAVRFAHAFEKTEDLSHQLQRSNQLKDEFLSYTSHELKTPLHGIMNITSDLLDNEERNLTARQEQNLWLIKDTSMKLSMLIHDLIDVTRLKHGELRLKPGLVDVRVAVQIVFDVLQFELLGKNLRLENRIESGVWVSADENRLRQVLYNLIHNAIKHTHAGKITVSLRETDGMAEIFVEDTGTGIPSNKHEAIFNYFEQAHDILPQEGYTGMGIGLYLSRKLIEQMGGIILVDWSETGRGTRMKFTLPVVRQPLAFGEAAAASAENQRGASGSAELQDILDNQGSAILIVDDEASNIHVLLHILKRHQYNVITAFSAHEAMDKLRSYPQIDLVILDVMMPVTSGLDLCRKLRERYSILDLPVLFATAKDTPQDIAAGFRAGANDYVTKPFDADTLVARIQTLIAMKTSIQEAIRNEQAFYQAQIKPHFLYNALSSVIAFCYKDGKKAAYLLGMLSQYLRYILDMDRSRLSVPLSRELELIEAYVEIEKARYGGRFRFECHMEGMLRHWNIPTLCIQPFVENAIRHGLFEKEEGGVVRLSLIQKDKQLEVIVEDNGTGISAERLSRLSSGEGLDGGIGIRNIRQRLDSIPGSTFKIQSEIGAGVKVTMMLPALNESGAGRRGQSWN